MRNMSQEECVIVTVLKQMVIDYYREVDFNKGENADEYFTDDCEANVGSIKFFGRDGVRKFYADRENNIKDTHINGVRTTRHVCLNMQVTVSNERHAKVNYLIATFAGSGEPPIFEGTLPVSISDIEFVCILDPDGQWKISQFNGSPIFIGIEDFARKSILGK